MRKRYKGFDGGNVTPKLKQGVSDVLYEMGQRTQSNFILEYDDVRVKHNKESNVTIEIKVIDELILIRVEMNPHGMSWFVKNEQSSYNQAESYCDDLNASLDFIDKIEERLAQLGYGEYIRK